LLTAELSSNTAANVAGALYTGLPSLVAPAMERRHEWWCYPWIKTFRHGGARATSGVQHLAKVRSGIVALPLLLVLQIGQYLRFLEFHGLYHTDFLHEIGDEGGIHGYCAGLASAIAIACSADEDEVVQHTAIVLRVLLAVGAYSEIFSETYDAGSTTLAIRLKYESQGDDLTSQFPGTYVSAITDPRSVSIVGPAKLLGELYDQARAQGLSVQKMDVRGKVHNPENQCLAVELSSLCQRTQCLQLPTSSHPRVSVRSNTSAGRLLQESLIEELVATILASKCDWFTLLTRVAEDMKLSGRDTHDIISFGLNDCVPMLPFLKNCLQVKKSEAKDLLRHVPIPPAMSDNLSGVPMFPENAVAITGASCRLPGAKNLDELSSIERRYFGNFFDVKRFDNSFFGINAKEATNMDPQQRILLELSYEALEAANYLPSHCRESGDNVGCFIGASFVEYLDNTSSHSPTAYTSTGTSRAYLCGRLSHFYGWSGPSEVIDTACSSSLVAIHRACKALQTGECEMALAGGVNIITGIHNFLDLGKAGFLSSTGQCKPFDRFADGYCRSDGAGLVVLKNLKQAVQAGDQILGVIPGVATNQGGLSTSITIPDCAAQKSLYRKVLQQAGLKPYKVTYVEAHGTGTQAGDPIELDSIRSVFGSPSRPDPLFIGSVKGNIGHCETAAGVAGLLKILAMLRHRGIPPQANHQDLNPRIPPLEPDGLRIADRPQPWDVTPRAALVTSYGAAGTNCALLCCDISAHCAGTTHAEPDAGNCMTLPIILGAASDGSLKNSTRSLQDYIGRNGSELSVGDIAFTLNECRKRLTSCISVIANSTTNLAQKLESAEFSSFKYPPRSRPVVLVFGGQAANRVGLDMELYQTYPIFRSYIDACDAEITKLGFRTIRQAIFQAQEIDDIVCLQCSIFSVQYACARTWIDAGLKVDTIIGHSLGELTALAVSEALSLADCIRLIAHRAHAMLVHWGAEKGAMLAIYAKLDVVENLICRLDSVSNMRLEVACYNAIDLHTVAGTSTAIDSAMQLLSKDGDSRSPKFQRLSTTHGFHCSLTEPVLPHLREISNSLEWHEPRIRLELCTAEPTTSLQHYSVSQHAREPVFFADAVQRIEDRLGLCMWIEAGFNTPVIPIIKRASHNPNTQEYQAMTAKGPQVEIISHAVSNLWQRGISLTHWSFLPKKMCGYKQVWLPPYQFEHSLHWLEHVDRVKEMERKIIIPSETQKKSIPPPPQLVSRNPSPSADSSVTQFYINTDCKRFQNVVAGHAVRGRALCPASMYMECVIMAIQLSCESLDLCSLNFQTLDFQSPLGIDAERQVILEVEELNVRKSWRFRIQSFLCSLPDQRGTTHVHGHVSLDPQSRLDAIKGLVSDSIRRVEAKLDIERLLTKRAYRLFALVVNYNDFFKGISAITMDGKEAAASVQLPYGQPHREESTASERCDTVLIDTFIQVLGLLINSSEAVSTSEVMVAVGIEHTVISNACRAEEGATFQVCAKITSMHDFQAVGDVFVCSLGGELVASLHNCRFSKLAINKLERSLDAANTKVDRGSQPSATDKGSIASSLTTEGFVTPSESESAPTKVGPVETSKAQSSNRVDVMEVILNYTGLSESMISPNISLGELGLDSLASMEMAEELTSKFGLAIDAVELVTITSDALSHRLEGFASSSETSENGRGTQAAPGSLRKSSADHSLQHLEVLRILGDAIGIDPKNIEGRSTLGELGIDSLTTLDLKEQIEETFHKTLKIDQPILGCTVSDIVSAISSERSQHPPCRSGLASPVNDLEPNRFPAECEAKASVANPLEALALSNTQFEDEASKRGFYRYWTEVSPLQDEVLLAYISEGFGSIGIDLSILTPGTVIPPVPHMPKYENLLQRLYDVLESYRIIVRQPKHIVRGVGDLTKEKSHNLQQKLRSQFPAYISEANLLNLTGSKLAQVLVGNADPISLMFGSSSSMRIMEDFYAHSPMMSTLTQQLITFLTHYLPTMKPRSDSSIRILEVGAGTGGTSKALAEALEAAGIKVHYTFTDISPSLVAKARSKLRHYPWMEFATFNVENEVPEAFRNGFDIVISANCIHATMNRVSSCRKLRDMLADGGIVILSEVTRVINWYDICFGLLDGWWLAEGGSAYPLQPAQAWMSTFEQAGFESRTFSRGATLESWTQQLLVASKETWHTSVPVTTGPSEVQMGSFRLETMTYKEVNGVQIHADVYLPQIAGRDPMPVALMIHGGGHMTLSRKAIRSAQTKHLLANGFLPVSVDYRLCPEVTLVEGPMADVLDAYVWVRTTLPYKLLEHGLVVDSENTVVIGWSTGGHLAMSICWNARMSSLIPPTAVLSFYAPKDFESGELERCQSAMTPQRRLRIENTLKILPRTPITHYDLPQGDTADFGCVHPGDPRGDLILSLLKDGIGLPLLINGFCPESGSDWLKTPTTEQITTISPLAQLRQGNYNTPTFVIHSTSDEVVPFASAERFDTLLEERGVKHGFLKLEGLRHIHDLHLRPGTREWEEQVEPGYIFLFDIVKQAREA
ncbi:MAG: hypothetical protein Q9166_006855, partial [cf. Caloplaca sp. 2 TL-2023]